METGFVNDENGGYFTFTPGDSRYMNDEILRAGNAEVLWDLLRSKKDGGRGAHVYVCGRTGFASSVIDAIRELLARHSDGTGEEKKIAANGLLYRLMGEERYMQDIFTTYTGPVTSKEQTFLASDIVLHNNDEDGRWMIIDGRVYDVNDFAQLHAGGSKIVHAYSGMDGTPAYRKVLHHDMPEVHSMLGMYEIGAVRRLDFGMEWGVAVGPDGLHFLTLSDVYRAWVRALYNVVEMENALNIDYGLKDQTIIADDSPTAYPPIKLQYLLEVHERFMVNFVDGATGQILEDLWAVTSGLCSQDQDVRWMKDYVARIRKSSEFHHVEGITRGLQDMVDELSVGDDSKSESIRTLKRSLDLLEVEDKRFLHDMKMTLRSGVQVFEECEADAVRSGRDRLMAAIYEIPLVLETYKARALSGPLAGFSDPRLDS